MFLINLTSESVHVLVLTIEWSYYVHGTNAIIVRQAGIFTKIILRCTVNKA